MLKITNPRPYFIPYIRSFKQRVKKKGFRRLFYGFRRLRQLKSGSKAFYLAEESKYLQRAKSSYQHDKVCSELRYHWIPYRGNYVYSRSKKIPYLLLRPLIAASEKKRQQEQQAIEQHHRYIALNFNKYCRALAWSMGTASYQVFLADGRERYFSRLLVTLYASRYFLFTNAHSPWGEYWRYEEITPEAFSAHRHRSEFQTTYAPFHLKAAIERSDQQFEEAYRQDKARFNVRRAPTLLDM